MNKLKLLSVIIILSIVVSVIIYIAIGIKMANTGVGFHGELYYH